jgi:hypothetical protein
LRYSKGIVTDRSNAAADRIGPTPLLELMAGALIVAEGRLPEEWISREREGKVEMRGEWYVTGLPAAGRGMDVTRFRISGRGEWIDGSVSQPNQGGDAVMREITIVDGQRCRVDAFSIVAGNR